MILTVAAAGGEYKYSQVLTCGASRLLTSCNVTSSQTHRVPGQRTRTGRQELQIRRRSDSRLIGSEVLEMARSPVSLQYAPAAPHQNPLGLANLCR